MKAKVDYICDWHSESGDDQRGHITVTTDTGLIEGTWSCTGGMGDGSELVTTKEFTDDEAEELLNAADLCQGDGTYTTDIVRNQFDFYTVKNVVWQS